MSNVTTDFYMVEDFLRFWWLFLHVLYFIWSLVILATYHVRISTSHIYFYPALVFILSFIWGSFTYDLYSCVYICVIFICIFYFVTGHHGRSVWLNGPPCIIIFQIKINKKHAGLWINLQNIASRASFGVEAVTGQHRQVKDTLSFNA